MSDPKDELPPPVVPESERLGLEDTLRRFVSGLNYSRVSTVPKLADHFVLRMELEGNLCIRYRLPEPIPLGDEEQVEERAIYLVERKTKGRAIKPSLAISEKVTGSAFPMTCMALQPRVRLARCQSCRRQAGGICA